MEKTERNILEQILEYSQWDGIIFRGIIFVKDVRITCKQKLQIDL